MSGFKRFSLTSCALLLSLSNIAYADTETPVDTPAADYEKGYVLTPVDSQGVNTITKYNYNPETKVLEPQYYQLDLSKTKYGEGNTTKTFTLTDAPVKDVEVTVKYDTPNTSNSNYTNVYNDQTLKLEATNPSSSSSEHYEMIGGAIKDADFSNSILFENNRVDAVLSLDSSTYSSGDADVLGGVLYNNSKIENIIGAFVNNSINASVNVIDQGSGSIYAYGGALYNEGEIVNITGDFIGNTVTASGVNSIYSHDYDSYGGAIYNIGTIGDIIGNFVENSTSGTTSHGGAIYNEGAISNITGDFIGNTATAPPQASPTHGGAIYNKGEITNITGDFISNESGAGGSAIYNAGNIADITGNFIENSAPDGGAIYNSVDSGGNTSYIGIITGDFIANNASYSGGAIYNSAGYASNSATIKSITGDFINNSAGAGGGAIYNSSVESYGEGAKIGEITANFINNSAGSSGGAIYNSAACMAVEASIGNITGDFINNSAGNSGGAIYNYADYDEATIGTISGSFINNHAGSIDSEDISLGGAIYTNNSLDFLADGQTHYISGNYTEDSRGKIDNAIFVGVDKYHPTPTLTFTAQNGGEYVIDDQIEGGSADSSWNDETGEREYTINHDYKYNLHLTGDKTGEIVLNNSVINADTTLDEVTLHLTKGDILATSTLTANSGNINTLNGIAEVQQMQSAVINGHVGMKVDVDLASVKMDRLPENVVTVNDGGHIDVEYLNLLSDAEYDKTDIPFADENYSHNVTYSGADKVAYSPIYKYDVSYNQDNGIFTFLRGNVSTGNPSDGFNPAVLSTGVAAQAGAYATQMNAFHYAFQHLDNFMNLPSMDRIAIKNQNRYALTSTPESGLFSPIYTEGLGSSYWIKPYVSFESIPLNNGPKVDNINYGTLIGFDGEMKPIAHGFDRVLSGYVGYNGASQSYSGVDSYQNGGLLGGTMFLYKGNFFNATTLSVGASIGENHNMYGNEDFTMLLAGIGNRLGYNFEFKGGKYIIQPSMLMSYTFVNTFDYTNSAGLNIESDPMHVIQLSPGVKFIMNTRNGWQPYATVNMVWNIMDSQKVTANAVRLPEMSVDPYVQYGLGIQKRIKDKFVAFGQALVSNGGRNGVSLTFGLRWFLGKE